MTQPPGPFVPPSQPPQQPPRPPAGQASVPLQPPPPGPYGNPAPPVSGGPAGAAPPGSPAAAPAPKRKRGVGFAIFVAFVAVLLAVISSGIALWSLKKADDAQTRAAEALSRAGTQAPPPGQPTPTPTTAQPTEPQPTGTAEDGVPSAQPTINATTVLEVKYAALDLAASTNSSDVYIDLDAPRVGQTNPFTEADIAVRNTGLGSTYVEFQDGVDAAAAPSPDIRPNDCSEKINFSPLNVQDKWTFRKGDSFCVLTSEQSANNRGESQQMVVVTVKDLSPGTVVITAKAWRMPR